MGVYNKHKYISERIEISKSIKSLMNEYSISMYAFPRILSLQKIVLVCVLLNLC